MRIAFLTALCSAALLLGAGSGLAASSGDATSMDGDAPHICRAPIHEGVLLVHAKQCFTQAEWDARRKRMQYSVHELQIRSLVTRPR